MFLAASFPFGSVAEEVKERWVRYGGIKPWVQGRPAGPGLSSSELGRARDVLAVAAELSRDRGTKHQVCPWPGGRAESGPGKGRASG